MAVHALSAARAICELRDWEVSNLELQKILYIAHMVYLGETDSHPLIKENFEAWDYGPVDLVSIIARRGLGTILSVTFFIGSKA